MPRSTLANFRTCCRRICDVGSRRRRGNCETIAELVDAAGYGADRIRIDPSVVRGLEYYTGPVFEAELTFEVKDEKGRPVRFGSVGGGGRYDDLVARFTGQKVPATGFSIGVSRLQAALSCAQQGQGRRRRRPRHRHGDGEGAHRRLPEDGAGAARRRHPRRAVPRQPEEVRQAARVRRQARLARASSSRARTSAPRAR